jgi:hypothetical protein
MIRVLFELMGAVVRLALEVVKLLVEFAAAKPMLALGAVAIVVLALLWSAVAYFWLLALGVVLVGAGFRLRTQGL